MRLPSKRVECALKLLVLPLSFTPASRQQGARARTRFFYGEALQQQWALAAGGCFTYTEDPTSFSCAGALLLEMLQLLSF